MHTHPDNDKLLAIARAIERIKGKGTLPSVRRDSFQWATWRDWFRERGFPTGWSDNQPGDRMMTVVFEYPPLDLEATYEKWVKGGSGEKPKLVSKVGKEI